MLSMPEDLSSIPNAKSGGGGGSSDIIIFIFVGLIDHVITVVL